MSKPFICGEDVPVHVPSGGCDCNYTLTYFENDDYYATYKLMLFGEQVGDTIHVPLDKYVNGGEVKEVVIENNPYPGAQIGDSYLELTFENSDDHLYIPLNIDVDLSNYYTKPEVDDLIDQYGFGGYIVVDSLPETGDSKYIYLVDTGSGYDQYAWDAENDDWINIGSSSISLDDYYTKGEVDNILDQYFKRVYPVGSIYISLNNTSPATLFGGTWQRIQNTFLYGVASGSADNPSTSGNVTSQHGYADIPVIAHAHTTATGSTTGSNTHSHNATSDGSDPAFVTMVGTTTGLGRRRVSSNASGSGNAAVPGQPWNLSLIHI